MNPHHRRNLLRLDSYGDVFLSPESAIQAVLDERGVEDDALAIDEIDEFIDDIDENDDELLVQRFARNGFKD